jgi:hypothetical protein
MTRTLNFPEEDLFRNTNPENASMRATFFRREWTSSPEVQFFMKQQAPSQCSVLHSRVLMFDTDIDKVRKIIRKEASSEGDDQF